MAPPTTNGYKSVLVIYDLTPWPPLLAGEGVGLVRGASPLYKYAPGVSLRGGEASLTYFPLPAGKGVRGMGEAQA
jgi:hypothetical protein